MKNINENGWKRDQYHGAIDHIWVGAMIIIAFSIVSSIIPLSYEMGRSESSEDSIMVLNKESNEPVVTYMGVESRWSVFDLFKSNPNLQSAMLRKVAKPGEAKSIETSVSSSEKSQIAPPPAAEQLKTLHPGMITLPAAQKKFQFVGEELVIRSDLAVANSKISRFTL